MAEGEVHSFGAGEKKNDFSDMWTIIMRLIRSKWFLNYATSCTWNENNKMEKLSQKLPWLYLCINEIDVTDIGEQYSVKGILREFINQEEILIIKVEIPKEEK